MASITKRLAADGKPRYRVQVRRKGQSSLCQTFRTKREAEDWPLYFTLDAGPNLHLIYPAAYDNVIGVGALAADGKPWNQSNHGDFVSVSAPGVADLPVGYQGAPGTYAGTSIASAYIARRVAAILDRTPNADRDDILKMLLSEE